MATGAEPATPRVDEQRATRAEQDRVLFQRYHDARDPVDREMLVERFMPLARQLARRYKRAEEPFDDIFQVACLGLVKAIDRYDPGQGTAFSSYAVPTVVGEIKRYFRDRTWSVRVPRDLQELALKVDRAVGELSSRFGRQPSVEEVAQVVGVGDEEVLEALQASQAHRATSFEAPRGGGEDEEGDTLGDALGEDDAQYRLAEHRATLAILLRELTGREREVLRLRFEEDLTQEEIGRIIGVSQMQISRIIRGALEKLRGAAQSPSP